MQCEEELPQECDPAFNDGVEICGPEGVQYYCASDVSLEQGYTVHQATTAIDEDNSDYIKDGVVRLYGLSNQHDACNSDYFDVLDGLELFRYDDNGTARLKGSIQNMENASITFDVDMYFDARMLGSEFDDLSAATGFLTQGACDVDTDALITYVLKNGISKLTGTGSMTGEIFLNHQPMSLNKRFQLGFGGNNHNCAFGFGGWFGWQGVLNGQSVMGFSGDVIADLTEGVGFETDCGGEFVEHTYACVNIAEGTSIYVTQRIERNDTHAPTFNDAAIACSKHHLLVERHHGCQLRLAHSSALCWTSLTTAPIGTQSTATTTQWSLAARWNTPKRSSKATAQATSTILRNWKATDGSGNSPNTRPNH